MVRKKPAVERPAFLSGEQRLNKVLAAAGLGSRRQVEELIEQERVIVDGQTCTDFGMRVDASTAKISVDGESLKSSRPVYYAVHKPAGVLCTNSDPQGRTRIIDMVPDSARLFSVGRLDRSSTGLILLTNDGEIAQRLAHPKYEVSKTYFVVVQGKLDVRELAKLRRGIRLAEGWARVENAKIRRYRKAATELEIILSEGKNREIRRVLARLGHKVVVLRRLAIGNLRLGDLPEGAYRKLSMSEVDGLYEVAVRRKKPKKKDGENAERDPRKAKPKSKPKAAGLAADSGDGFRSSEAKPTGSPTGSPHRSSAGSKPTPAKSNRQAADSKPNVGNRQTSDADHQSLEPEPHLISMTPSDDEVANSDGGVWDEWDSTPTFLKEGGVIDYEDETPVGEYSLDIDSLGDEDDDGMVMSDEYDQPIAKKPGRKSDFIEVRNSPFVDEYRPPVDDEDELLDEDRRHSGRSSRGGSRGNDRANPRRRTQKPTRGGPKATTGTPTKKKSVRKSPGASKRTPDKRSAANRNVKKSGGSKGKTSRPKSRGTKTGGRPSAGRSSSSRGVSGRSSSGRGRSSGRG